MTTSTYNADQAAALRAKAEQLRMRAEQLDPTPAGIAEPVAGGSRVLVDLPDGACLVVAAVGVSEGAVACIVRDVVGALLAAQRAGEG
ncbi:hypothetical protein ABWU93_11570 [Xanthomonas translucens pv. translucens]|uniref:hypothetical protein n=1 Tax=Xanthomonas campestris pv. translucens TaxID=343 RepID=UPI003F7228A9